MKPFQISRTDHPIIKRLVQLRKKRSFRIEEKSLLITGKTLVREVADRKKIKLLLTTEPLTIEAEEIFYAPASLLTKVIGFSTTDLVAAEISLPDPSPLRSVKRLIILDAVADPGNVGTILRTALALGWDAAFCTPKTADPFNEKAIRASRGAALFLPIKMGNWDELSSLLKVNKMDVYVADVKGTALSSFSFQEPLALILGNETRGVSSHEIGVPLSIPLNPYVESLNVAAAAAICMHQIREKIEKEDWNHLTY